MIIYGLDYMLDLKGIRKDELAKELNMSKQTMNYWYTKDGVKIPKKYAETITKYFDVPLIFLESELEVEVKYNGVSVEDYLNNKGFKEVDEGKQCLRCCFVVNSSFESAYNNNWCPNCGFNVDK